MTLPKKEGLVRIRIKAFLSFFSESQDSGQCHFSLVITLLSFLPHHGAALNQRPKDKVVRKLESGSERADAPAL